MKKSSITFFLILSVMLTSCLFTSCGKKSIPLYNQDIHIIPQPSSMEVVPNGFFTLSRGMKYYSNTSEGLHLCEFFLDKIKASTSISMRKSDVKISKGLYIKIDTPESKDFGDEEYQLVVYNDKVMIFSKTAKGAFYGMQTFMQLMPAEIESPVRVRGIQWIAPMVMIKDSPRFLYRGLMLDVCRHFRSVDFIKKQLDVMAMFKMNVFHWHLTEDQAWRIEIKKYPKLTQIGSTREEGEGFIHKGYYTQEQIKEIVAYAKERYITVIPELEIPGHELAAISAYPNLSCTGEQVRPWNIWGVSELLMCPGKEDMFIFLDNVIKELVELFPSEYYHIGGDEAPKTNWEKCPLCQKRIKELGIKDKPGYSAENQLQGYVVKRVEKMLAKYGKKIIGWDEILDANVEKSATIMSWRGESGGIKAAKAGYDVIMTPNSGGLYMDYYQGDPKVEPVGIGGYFPLWKTYSYNPMSESLQKQGIKSHILGIQANVWSEYMYSDKIMEYRIYPRAIAVAEIAWANKSNQNFKDFCRKLDNAEVRLDMHKITYHIPIPEQNGGSFDNIGFLDSITVKFSTTRPMRMIYTLNSKKPKAFTKYTKTYNNPLTFKKDVNLKICSVLSSGKISKVRNIMIRKMVLRSALTAQQISKYPKKGYLMRKTDGLYHTSIQLFAQKREWEDSTITEFKDMCHLNNFDNQRPYSAKHYASTAEGLFNVSRDGVYKFSSNQTQVLIDGELLINNDGYVKRYSRKDACIALKKGLHEIKVVFLGNISGGVPSYWDSGKVTYQFLSDVGTINVLP
ncbi:MAG: beta-N-acetylhexosaminidase [Bacteroidales bacterium]